MYSKTNLLTCCSFVVHMASTKGLNDFLSFDIDGYHLHKNTIHN